jgi:hypothetical protein
MTEALMDAHDRFKIASLQIRLAPQCAKSDFFNSLLD